MKKNNDRELVTKGFLRQELDLAMDKAITKAVGEMTTVLKDFMKLIDDRFDKQDQRFERIERKMDRFMSAHNRSDDVLDDHEVRIRRLEERLTRV